LLRFLVIIRTRTWAIFSLLMQYSRQFWELSHRILRFSYFFLGIIWSWAWRVNSLEFLTRQISVHITTKCSIASFLIRTFSWSRSFYIIRTRPWHLISNFQFSLFTESIIKIICYNHQFYL
jgi:hypothetical protein